MKIRETIKVLDQMAKQGNHRAELALWKLISARVQIIREDKRPDLGAMYDDWKSKKQDIASILYGVKRGRFTWQLNRSTIKTVTLGETIVADLNDTGAADTLDSLVTDARLDDTEVSILSSLRAGFEQWEIADKLGTYPMDISRRVATILEKLRNSVIQAD